MTRIHFCLLPLLAVMASAADTDHKPYSAGMVLRENWSLQQSTDVRENGEALSTPGFRARNWYRAIVPTTVFSALVANHVYPDPYFGMNLRSASGVSYPISTNFSNTDMPPESP